MELAVVAGMVRQKYAYTHPSAPIPLQYHRFLIEWICKYHIRLLDKILLHINNNNTYRQMENDFQNTFSIQK